MRDSSTRTDDATALGPDEALEAFEEAWQRGSSPRLEAFVPAPAAGADEPAWRGLVAELVAIDLEYRWRKSVPNGRPPGDLSGAGRPFRPRLEHYLARFPELSSPDGAPPAALVAEEYRVRLLWGDRPGLTEYQARFGRGVPGLEEALARVDAEIAAEWPGLLAPAGGTAAPGDTAQTEAPEGLPFVAGYELLGVVGQGGMGVVYKARHLRLKRLVALKMIRSGPLADAHERSRFRAEAEAAARLQHPNIVQIFEVGQQDGRPFVAFEYVAGGTLADLLAGGPLQAERAAGLAETLARAVAAAHRQGVIHRDLNPANILLAPDPGDPVLGTPKIGDFGLAKRVGDAAELGVSTAGRTGTGAILGTPGYMPPEQAEGGSREAAPPADVYALGTILYEALTGRPPFRAPTVLETLEQVRTRAPVGPSQLQPGVPRDLETICLKCLEKEPHRRYPSADALAEDLRRFRAGEPIEARPAPAWRRAALWARRRPAPAALAIVAAVLIPTLAGLGVAYTLSLRAANARAEANFRRAFEAVDRMLMRVGDRDLADVPEMETVRRDLLADAVAFLRALVADPAGAADPALKRNLARAYHRLARVHDLLGQATLAEQELGRAIALQTRNLAEAPGRPDYRGDLADSRYDFGLLLDRSYRRPRAEEELRAARDLWEPMARDDPSVRLMLAHSYDALSRVAAARGRAPDAERDARKALDLLDAGPGDPETEAERTRIFYNLGLLYYTTGRVRDAERLFQRCLNAWEPAGLAPRATSEDRKRLAECYHSLGYLRVDERRLDLAEALLRKELALRETLARQFPHSSHIQDSLARAHFGLGVMLFTAGRRTEAEAAYAASAAIRETLVREHPDVHSYRQALAETYQNMGLTSSDWARGRANFERALTLAEGLKAEHPDDPAAALPTAILTNLGLLSTEQGLRSEALDHLNRAVAVGESVVRASPGRLDIQRYLRNAHGARAQVRESLGRHADAAADWARVVELTEPSQRANFAILRCAALARAGRCEDAAAEAARLAAPPDTPGELVYNCACIYSIAASATADRAPREAASYADAAMALLRRARRGGYFAPGAGPTLLDQDHDLDALRNRDDFRAFLLDLGFPADPFAR